MMMAQTLKAWSANPVSRGSMNHSRLFVMASQSQDAA